MPRAAHLERGRWAESCALAYLNGEGLQLVARNFRVRLGELDLVMLDGPLLVFVEVRYRASTSYGAAHETVTRAKQRRLHAAAELFRARYPQLAHRACRFDVVSVTQRNYAPHCNWIRDAFS
ncbi:MAG: YraN family protein [Pseudomonadales bacterium]